MHNTQFPFFLIKERIYRVTWYFFISEQGNIIISYELFHRIWPQLYFNSAEPIGFYVVFLKKALFSPQNKIGESQRAQQIGMARRFNGRGVRIQIYLLQMKRNPYLDSEEYEGGINWNPSSHFEEEELCLAHCSVQYSEVESEKKRPSHKNKYINKITLIKPEETANTKKRHKNSNDSALHPEQLKKMKNREAAKESRQRKKLYINLIEEQTKKLEKEIEITNREIENCKIEIQKSSFNNNQLIGAFDSKRVHVFKKMERLLAAEDGEEKNNEINLALDSIIYRYGATGKERKNNITESYRQILAITPSIVQRYLLWAAKQKAHIFADSQQDEREEWFEEMRRLIMGNLAQHPQLLEETRISIAGNQGHYSKSVQELKHTKDEIQKFLNVLDSNFMEMRDTFTPTQSAKLFLFIEKYKYRQQLRFVEHKVNLQNEFPQSPMKEQQV